MGNLGLFDVIEKAAETSPTLGDEQELDACEDAAAYGEAGPEIIQEDPDPYGIIETDDHNEEIPDEICACMMVDDWAAEEEDGDSRRSSHVGFCRSG